MIRPLCILVAVCACSSSNASPAATPPPVDASQARRPLVDAHQYGLTLPAAENALDEAWLDSPQIVVSGDGIWIDATPVGNLREVNGSGKLRRVDPLFSDLKRRRDEWRARQVGVGFCGCATLWFDRRVRLTVFKSVFQTAAFAGYPNLRVAVTTPAAGVGYLSFDARVPAPPGLVRSEVTAHVEYAPSGELQLIWKLGSKVERATSIGERASSLGERLPELGARLTEQWHQFGGHQGAQDVGLDQIVVHLPNELVLADAVAVIDRVYATKRQYLVDGKPLVVPAFNLTFSVN